jgi:uncharacterized repeat protein (TIGR01451 family)
VIDGLGLMDIDANLQTIVATLTINSGVLTLTTTASNGLTGGQVSGNGTNTVVATGSLAQINTSLAYSPALIYRSNPGFYGLDTATLTVNDQGNTGGSALTGQKSFLITVQAPDLQLAKTVNSTTAQPGQRITYTLLITNLGNLTATNATVADTLPTELTYAGPVSLTPAGVGVTGSPPNLVTGLTVTPGQQITVTFPVTLNANLTASAQITNTATITNVANDINLVNNSGAVAVTVSNSGTPDPSVYLPLVIKSN